MSERDSICAPEEKLSVEYRDIPGYSGYRAGDDGSVWSFKRRVPKRLAAAINGGGYPYVMLCNNGIERNERVHRLILLAFVGPAPSDNYHGCHNNSVRSDCRLSNLRWDTPKGNHADTIALGRTQTGSKNKAAKLTDELVRQARREYASGGVRLRELSARLGIRKDTMRKALLGITWKHIEGPLPRVSETVSSEDCRRAGLKGGPARAALLSKERRSEIGQIGGEASRQYFRNKREANLDSTPKS